ncbi:hypothetical protein CF336_g9672 [Tilletia laevis]|nr:hypothetical protein CF336_g9672 [Tilletia laevis]
MGASPDLVRASAVFEDLKLQISSNRPNKHLPVFIQASSTFVLRLPRQIKLITLISADSTSSEVVLPRSYRCSKIYTTIVRRLRMHHASICCQEVLVRQATRRTCSSHHAVRFRPQSEARPDVEAVHQEHHRGSAAQLESQARG